MIIDFPREPNKPYIATINTPNYRSLLTKYMQLIVREEDSDYLHYEHGELFSPEEKAWLILIAKEL